MVSEIQLDVATTLEYLHYGLCLPVNDMNVLRYDKQTTTKIYKGKSIIKFKNVITLSL